VIDERRFAQLAVSARRRFILGMKLFFTGAHSAALMPATCWASSERLDDREADRGDNSQSSERITYSERDLAESG